MITREYNGVKALIEWVKEKGQREVNFTRLISPWTTRQLEKEGYTITHNRNSVSISW